MRINVSKDTQVFKVDKHRIGPGHPCFIIAEAGVNHNGSLNTAKRLVDIAVSAGADAVKFQTFKAQRIVSPVAPKAEYQLRNTGVNESQYNMLRHLELSSEAHLELFEYCKKNDILFMSSPFDEESVDFLADLGIAVFKIPSGEITNLPYLAYVAEKKKPMIVSTGMANLGEVETAIKILEKAGNRNIVLLQCVSTYPASPENVNLRAMQTMATAFGVPVGYSDHTKGIEVALAAVALGACVIEKHFTLDRNLSGPDHLSSLDPDELKALVRGIRIVESALGHGRKEPAESEVDTASAARKSLVAAQVIPVGTTLTKELIAIKRPGTGLPPFMRPYLIGRTLRQTVNADTLFTMEMLK
jgi:N-acetylneuraminate synthase